jgi:hypothetical protein
MEKPARDFITAGRSDQRVPAHSPLPDLFLAAIGGAADQYKRGIVSAAEIRDYMLNELLQMREINLTPQVGRLPDPDFSEGAFLFRTLSGPAEENNARNPAKRPETPTATEVPCFNGLGDCPPNPKTASQNNDHVDFNPGPPVLAPTNPTVVAPTRKRGVAARKQGSDACKVFPNLC